MKLERAAPNPWKLNRREQEAIDSIIRLGSAKETARDMGVAPKTMETYALRIRKKMGVHHTITAAVLWDRFKRGAAF